MPSLPFPRCILPRLPLTPVCFSPVPANTTARRKPAPESASPDISFLFLQSYAPFFLSHLRIVFDFSAENMQKRIRSVSPAYFLIFFSPFLKPVPASSPYPWRWPSASCHGSNVYKSVLAL